MKDHYKTKTQLVRELVELRGRVQSLLDAGGGREHESPERELAVSREQLAKLSLERDTDAVLLMRRSRQMEQLAREVRSANDELRAANSGLRQRERYLAALAREADVNRSIARFSRALISSATLPEISTHVLSEAARLVGAARGFVGHLDGKTGYLICPALAGCDGEAESALPLVFKQWSGPWGGVMSQHRPRLDNRVAPEEGARLLPFGEAPVGNVLAVPALVGARALGLLVLADKPGGFTEGDRDLLEELASLYALAVHRSQSEGLAREAALMGMLANLAGGVAHDFNNLMVGVLGYAELLKRDLADQPDKARMLDIISIAARRAGELTYQLLAFARAGQYAPRVLDLNALIRETLEREQNLFPSRVHVHTDFEPELWNVEADPGQLAQVVIQLCRNGVEAIEDEGWVQLSTRNLTVPGDPSAPPDLPAGDFVCLSVEDTGSGMDTETLARAFEPFFTTKFQGRGLGLAAVYGIIRNHGGRVTSESRKDEGATFRVYLPARLSWPAEESARILPGGRETLLVVDGDEETLGFLERGLTPLGYRLQVARTAAEATSTLSTGADDVRLVLWDPASTGSAPVEFVRTLRALSPGLPILVCCDPGMTLAALKLLPYGVRDFAAKPLHIESLALLLRMHLESGAGRP